MAAVPGPTLVVHGHFYQPPRENPWTEEVAVEASAAPWSNWNERIVDQSYRANGWARVVDDDGRVVAIVDNYERLSFDAGPTLLSWLERHAPDVYERMRLADRLGGGAVAQAYNHIILPLASERDVRTQVRWGLADFRHRFGRPAEGMWLPETAVDDVVLGVLAEEGVRFTILAPHQAARVRPLGDDAPWTEVSEGVDSRRTYRWLHPEDPGRGVDLVFYDGSISHDVAFGGAASTLVPRALGAAPEGGLVCVATDGETFGHHQPMAERALAHALPVEAPQAGVAVANAAGYLAAHPPEWQAAVRTSAWSCAHGVGRWAGDCGCSTGGPPGADQGWRAPLRAALDLVRDAGAEVFERRGAAVLSDPWAARDAYIEVILASRSVEAFATAHVTGGGADEGVLVEALTLLEQQRHALLMYTSCGWFFWDIGGLETVQILRYAARSLDLLGELGEAPPLEPFLALLGEARANQASTGTGRDVWDELVVPARVDAARAVASVVLSELARQRDVDRAVGGFDVVHAEHTQATRGISTLCSGWMTLAHRRTRRRSTHAYAALDLGGLGVRGAVRPSDIARDPDLHRSLHDALASGAPATSLLRRVVEGFGPETFGPEAALPPTVAAPAVEGGALAHLRDGLQPAFDEAVRRAVGGGGDAAAEAAIDVLGLARSLGAEVDLGRAQERVYEVLLAGRRPDLEALGRDVGLAAGNLGLPQP